MRVKNVSFTNLGLSAPILKTLSNNNYDTPTPIQLQAIPAVLAGRDVVGLAQTGTGKTAAFTLPILHRLAASKPAQGRPVRVLILSPTRELATQINNAIWTYSKGLGLQSTCVIGGVPIRKQQRILSQGIDILVATPGRLEDLVAQRSVRLNQVETVVLDEADQMLDIGFMPAIRRILKLVPQQRQTLLFSATMPKEIAALSQDHLTNPIEVSVTPKSSTAERIDQTVVHMEGASKPTAIFKLVQKHEGKRVIVFTRTKRGADKVARKLVAEGIGADAIHGNKSQGQRQRALDGFRKGNKLVLIATDVAARGIDIPDVGLVVNYDLPNVPEAYVHRIGRTARAGASGLAVTFCSPDEQKLLRAIEKLIKTSIPALDADGTPMPVQQQRFTEKTGDRRAPRRSGKPSQRRWHKSRRGKSGGGKAKSA
ncbi:MAG: DEAD/DEAH box helicase [Rhodobacteraceae bacterium]|nr:DEAD/DEAH box helicase [Paracoccaceae bacterium]